MNIKEITIVHIKTIDKFNGLIRLILFRVFVIARLIPENLLFDPVLIKGCQKYTYHRGHGGCTEETEYI